MHQPQRHPDNPILRGENPWESVASLYGTGFYYLQDSLFKMWYLTGPYADGIVQVRQRNALGNVTARGTPAVSTQTCKSIFLLICLSTLAIPKEKK